jgi:hypothetical protein
MMKKCRFNDPDYISLYYDGALDSEAEKKFSRHILTCKECSGALLALEKDLFLMNSIKLADVPERLRHKRAVFKIIKEGIRIIKNLTGPETFVPLELKATLDHRGEGEKKIYRLKTDSIIVDIYGEKDSKFCAEITGTEGKSISLYLSGKKIEAHGHVAEPGVLIDGLERGSYSLMVDEQLILEFDVE